MSNLPFASASEDMPHSKCSIYSQTYTESSMSGIPDVSSFTSNNQLIEQEIISENFRVMNVSSLPLMYSDPSKFSHSNEDVCRNSYGTEENLELQKYAWTGVRNQENSEICTDGSKNCVPESVHSLKETQEAVCDKNYPSRREDKEDHTNSERINPTEFLSDSSTTNGTVVKVEEDGVEMAWTDLKKLKVAQGFYYFCSICYSSFKTQSNAILHLQEHGITKPYRCTLCESLCQTEYEAKMHYQSHAEIKMFNCRNCGHHFLNEKVLQRHEVECGFCISSSKPSFQLEESILSSETPSQSEESDEEDETESDDTEGRKPSEIFSCDECSKCFSLFEELSKHKETQHFLGKEDRDNPNSNHSSSPKTTDLSENNLPLNNAATLNENNLPKQTKTVKKNSNKAQRNFTCSTCGKAFRASKPLREHEVVHTGARDFACEICGKAFGTRANMKIHLATHSDKRPFVCEVCDATFRQKDSLKVHLRKHSGERPFACTVCNMTFDRNFTLKNHLLTHGEERSYVCVVCGKAFTTRGGLNNHERLHSKDPTKKKARKPPSKPGTGNWICDECGKLYSTRSNLKMHQRSHEPTTVTHTCYVCGRVYKHKDSLEVHMRKHTDERPYTCSTCGRTFYRNWTLKLHILTHTGEKPHKCLKEGCDKAFTQSSSLYNHIQNHHKQTDRLKSKSGQEIAQCTPEEVLVNPATAVKNKHVNQSEPIAVNSIQEAALQNGHIEVAPPLFNTQDSPLPVNNLIIPTTITDSLNLTLSTDLAVKVGVEEIHPSVLNGLSLSSVTPDVSLVQRQDILPENTHMNQVVHPMDDPSSMCHADVSSNLIWENTVLPMGMTNITNMHLSQPHQTEVPPLPPLTQSIDQVYVMPDHVPLLVSLDGHLYQQDNAKMAGLQNNFVSQLR